MLHHRACADIRATAGSAQALQVVACPSARAPPSVVGVIIACVVVARVLVSCIVSSLVAIGTRWGLPCWHVLPGLVPCSRVLAGVVQHLVIACITLHSSQLPSQPLAGPL